MKCTLAARVYARRMDYDSTRTLVADGQDGAGLHSRFSVLFVQFLFSNPGLLLVGGEM